VKNVILLLNIRRIIRDIWSISIVLLLKNKQSVIYVVFNLELEDSIFPTGRIFTQQKKKLNIKKTYEPPEIIDITYLKNTVYSI